MSLGIGTALSSYFWFNQWVARQLPQFNDYVARVGGVELGHQFRWSQWAWYILVILALYFLYRTNKKTERLFVVQFFAILLFAGFVALNMQVITGLNLQPDHWFLRVIFIPQGLVFLMVLNYLLDILKTQKQRLVLLIVLSTLMVSLFAGSAHAAYVLAKQRFAVFHLPKGIMQSLKWLDRSIATDEVIVTPSLYMNKLFLYYTPAKVFFPEAFDTWASEDEILDRMYIVNKLFNVSSAKLSAALNPGAIENFYKQERLPTDINLLEYLYFQQFYSQEFDAYLTGRADNIIPAGKIEKMVEDYKRYKFSINDLGKKYRADYIYVGPLERRISAINFEGVKALEKVYDEEGVLIYKIAR